MGDVVASNYVNEVSVVSINLAELHHYALPSPSAALPPLPK